MRSRSLRVLFAAVLSLGSIWTAQLAVPAPVGACSCRQLDDPDLAKVAANPDFVVFIGMITSISPPGLGNHDFGDMQVQRIYKGALPPVARVRGGGGGDCTIALELGLRMIWVTRYADSVLQPQLCGLHADPASPEGRALVAAAERAFGIGSIPGLPPGSGDATAVTGGPDLSGVAFASIGLVVAVVAVAVIAAARRRREGPTA